MTLADISTMLVGKSRDALEGAPALPPTIPTIRARAVILHLWSLNPAHLHKAEAGACNHPGSGLWDVSEVVQSSRGLCPIPLHDRLALAQGADYGYAWAVYPAAAA